jgi:hypothetical protein
LLQQFTHAHADGSYPARLDTRARTQRLVLDDGLRDPLTATQTRDLLEVLDDRFGQGATLAAFQFPADLAQARARSPRALLDGSSLKEVPAHFT